ncbi:hypothetical protein MW887_009508 [Aspergillus wentii]|nr:hypothetical protein MW887_009508 [Aspergillus wentii]
MSSVRSADSRNSKLSSPACTNCKRSKQRCNIEHGGSCTNCAPKGEICDVRVANDGRRRRGRANRKVNLQARVTALEELLLLNSEKLSYSGMVMSEQQAETASDATVMDGMIAQEPWPYDHGECKTYFDNSIWHFDHSQSLQSCTAEDTPTLDLPEDLDPRNEPDPIVAHLVDIFWTWQAAHVQVIHRNMFLIDKKAFFESEPPCKRDFFSPSLLYAMMALASMTGDVFFDKAKRLFDAQMGVPSVATVQTAMLLGSRYGTLGETSLGWTYSGIAARTALEIGLHLNCEKAVAANRLPSQVAQARTAVFCGIYTQDKLWAVYAGRPSIISDPDITAKWAERPTDMLTTVHWNALLLAMHIFRILGELYSHKRAGDVFRLKSAANDIHRNLVKWYQDLDDELSWPNSTSTPASPHILIMHMTFYFTIILLHRPFIDHRHAVTSISNLDEASHNANTICALAATNIAKLTRDYSLFYDWRQSPSPAVHFVSTAAVILLVNIHLTGDEDCLFLFQGCLSGLGDMRESHPQATKAIGMLNNLLVQFQGKHSLVPQENACPSIDVLDVFDWSRYGSPIVFPNGLEEFNWDNHTDDLDLNLDLGFANHVNMNPLHVINPIAGVFMDGNGV